MPATVSAVVPIPAVVGRRPSMTKQFLLLFIAIMILMVAFAYEAGTLAVAPDNIRIEHHVVNYAPPKGGELVMLPMLPWQAYSTIGRLTDTLPSRFSEYRLGAS